jgi:uncharacterized membrane protein
MRIVVPLKLTLAVVLAAVLFVSGTCSATEKSRRFSEQLISILETKGIGELEAQYRYHRERGFVGVGESQADTNSLGYQLLRRGQTDAAIRIFRLNVETYPRSANAADSLAEAYLASGDRALAAAAYQRVLALDPRNRNARYELARLTGSDLPPFPVLVLLHILTGSLALLAGATAMLAPKGRPVHRAAGRLFMGAMLAMAGSAVIRAVQNLETEVLNFWMGLLTLYLVVSGWRAARQRQHATSTVDRALPLMALVVACGLLVLGFRGGAFAGAAIAFGAVAALAAVADARWLRRSPPANAARLVRHLWRVGLAMFIAVGSLFLGQSQVFPYEVRSTGLLAVPSALVAASVAYWFVRYRFGYSLRRFRSPGIRAALKKP